MSNKGKRIILGAASGVVTAVAMELLKNKGYLVSLSSYVSAIMAGGIAILCYFSLNMIFKIGRHDGQPGANKP